MRWFCWEKICPERFKRRQLNFSANVFFSIQKKTVGFCLKRERYYGGLSLEFGFRDLVCFAPNFHTFMHDSKEIMWEVFQRNDDSSDEDVASCKNWLTVNGLFFLVQAWTFCIEFRKIFPWDILRHTISQLQLLNFEMSLYSSLPTQKIWRI